MKLWQDAAPMTTVGTNVPRKEGVGKVTGATQYGDDLDVPGCLHGATVRSRVARGRIKSITLDPAFDWRGLHVVTAKDITDAGGENLVALIVDDQPALADGEIRHHAEPVALVAGEDLERVEEAVRHVLVDVEPLPPVLDPLAAAAAGDVMKEFVLEEGDLAAAFARADLVVEGEYRTGYQEQLYIEPQVMIAIPDFASDARSDPGGGGEPGSAGAPAGERSPARIVLRGSMQCPYYIHKALQRLLALGPSQVVVRQAATGGGFGGKEDYPSMIASHCALLARKSGRPVKILYRRQEDIQATTKRHPAIVRHRTAVKRDGTLLACDVDVIVDGGAYVTLTPVVVSRAALHGNGVYRWEAARIRARAVRTNTPPNGAFRGFGAPQAIFAVEAHIEKIAHELGLAPHELRRKNLVRLGDVLPTGQVLKSSVAISEVLEDALARADFDAKRARYAKENADGRRKVRGIGVSAFHHGAGFTGAGEVHLASIAGVEVTPEGKARVLVASTEIGQGARTTFAQIAADALGLGYDDVEIEEPDTSKVPDSGPTVASRTVMVVGGLVAKACAMLRSRVPSGSSLAVWARETPREQRRAYAQYEPPPGIVWDEATYRGDAYAAYGWGANVAEVEVDLDTGELAVLKLTASIDAGTVVHPLLAEGQVEGGTLQGLGWATIEELKSKDGRYLNDKMSTYVIPTSLDAPPISARLVACPTPHSLLGTKGLGELPIDGPAPAVCAAILHATGVLPTELPASPERLLAALDAAASGTAGTESPAR